jgi:hypothetical protein
MTQEHIHIKRLRFTAHELQAVPRDIARTFAIVVSSQTLTDMLTTEEMNKAPMTVRKRGFDSTSVQSS